MYTELTEEAFKSSVGEVVLLGEVGIEEEDIFLKGSDGYKLLLEFEEEDDPMRHRLSEYEGETVIIYGAVQSSKLKVLGHSSFKTPINMELFRKARCEMEKHEDFFSQETKK
ncbi:uncharacterized protein NEMAJ01_1356 [Nematocida major]|uniref:uncharacterized protein n=1 Tax=Nematocida major TaxID=1912982 RepID=UPI002007A5C2|nr:uncharacterized protein NEMAJ01_1356 [Nematocida major]KAH9386460.1 hypothetical protein NEMAJ01_1356 [Nematocida major]